MLQKGQVFNNRYKIISTLGEGGFGAVYKVWDDNLQRHCAIKENLQVSAEAQKQFKREAIMLANLNHPHLVRVTDYFFIADQGQYLVMDFIDGNDLQTILTDNGGPLPTEQALAWIRQVCDALIYIHNQNPPIIHRDIKPANIRITPQGNAVLVDFGLAKTFDVGIQTSMGARGLTPHFAAPEQYGMGGTDAQSDIYSLGVTLYCLLTYTVPPDSVEIMVGNANPPSPAKSITGNISDSVSDALQSAMQIRRTERFKSVTDFKNALSASQVIQIVSTAYKTPAQVDTSANKFDVFNMEFVRVPAGKFLMGSNNRGVEMPQHIVELSEYLIGKYPVTNLEYQAFVRDAKYKVPKNWKDDQFPANKGNHPVVGVSWDDAKAFCKWLSDKTGKQVRLPTEAEWEKAARGTDGRAYPWGDVFDSEKANTKKSKIEDTTDVGKFSPRGDSPYGCADMAGNVWEWVNDWYEQTYYQGSPSSNPLGPSSGDYRALRGGSWNYDDGYVHSAFRYRVDPTVTYSSIGFRCARSLPLLENSSPKPVQVVAAPVIKIDKSDSQNIPTYDNKLTLSNGMEFMRVPAGKFLMGGDDSYNDDSQPQHTVDILYGYWMARFPVTNELYNAYAKVKGIRQHNYGWEKEKDHPVGGVSWIDATEYCQWLNNLFQSEIPSSFALRLPNEAEWEKAARGIDARAYPWGNIFDKNNCNSVDEEEGREKGRKKSKTTPVGFYSPRGDSPYGCADMSGNVWEWVNDWYSETFYRRSPSSNPLGPSGTVRVLRGGSCYDYDLCVRSAFRLSCDPLDTSSNFGFRVLLAPIEEKKPAAEMPKPIQVVMPKNVTPTSNKLTLPNMEFVRVPTGGFLMGSNNDNNNGNDDDYYDDDDEPQHTVELSEYFIGKYPVTNLEYQAFVRDAKYKSPEGWNGDQFSAKKSNHPVVNVSWHDAIAFCKWLSQKTGKQYRLPTEAEWEKAARGTDGREYPWGDVFDSKKANTGESNIEDTTDVGKYSPQGDSPYGCADMAGNVYEWTSSLYLSYPYNAEKSEQADAYSDRTTRGGSWDCDHRHVRCANRYWDAPDDFFDNIGFRLVVPRL